MFKRELPVGDTIAAHLFAHVVDGDSRAGCARLVTDTDEEWLDAVVGAVEDYELR